MGIGAIGNQHFGVIHHTVGNVGMQVQGGDHRNVRADNATHHFEKIAIGVGGLGSRHAAVGAEINAVHRPGVSEAAFHFGHRFVKKGLVAWPVRFRRRH